MNKQSNEERARLKKLNETFLYDVGYEHMNNICDETDRLLEGYKELEVPDSLNQWFFNLVIETSQKFSLISQEEIGETQEVYEVPSEWGIYYYPEFLPEDYDLSSTRTLNDTKIMIFSNGTNQDIVFSQGPLSGESQIDSENGKVIEVDINGNNGVLAIKDDIKILNWSNNEMSFSIQGNVEESVLLAIAERIIKNK